LFEKVKIEEYTSKKTYKNNVFVFDRYGVSTSLYVVALGWIWMIFRAPLMIQHSYHNRWLLEGPTFYVESLIKIGGDERLLCSKSELVGEERL